MTEYSRLPILILVLIFGAAERSHSDERVDYAPILERIGIPDEPSILDRCNAEFSSIRVTGLAGGGPFAVFRLEFGRDGGRLTKRLIENGNPGISEEYPVSESNWSTLVDHLRKSGFWSYEHIDSYWSPDGHHQWIEACINGRFRSISIYPDKDDRMSEFISYLVQLAT